ncbi:MAG: hypothetical protein JWL59_3538 [Chthoniobacteraceae bacterium]|nr:hypothetical protein [Chthoniobacteraceae bacterium]
MKHLSRHKLLLLPNHRDLVAEEAIKKSTSSINSRLLFSAAGIKMLIGAVMKNA